MKSQLRVGAILGYANMAINIAVTVFYTPFMLGLMGQNEYGLYSLVTSIIAYLSVLDMGFGNAMVRFVAKSQARKNVKKEHEINGLFLLLYLAVGFIAFLIGIALFLNINNLFGSTLSVEELEKAKVIMLILVGTVAVSFPLSIFGSYAIASERFNFLKLLEIFKTLAVPITMIPLLLLGYKSIAMVIVTSAFTIICHLITMYYCLKKLKMHINFKIKNLDKSLLKSISIYSFWVFLNIIVDNVFNNTDQIILGSVCGTAAVAIYAIASKIAVMNTSFSTAISGLFLPKITKTLEEDDGDKKVSDLFIRVSRIQMYIMVLILSGFVVFGKHFIKLWIGTEYLDSYYITILLIAPAVIPLTQNLGISIIQAKNKHQFRSVMYIIIAILNVAISIPLAKQFAGIGAAIGTFVANLLGQIITMNIFYWKKIGIDIPKYWKNLIVFSIPVSILGFIFISITDAMEFSWASLIPIVSLYLIMYLVIMYFYANKSEKSELKRILRIKRK